MPEINSVEAIRAATLAAYAPSLSFVLSRALVSSSLCCSPGKHTKSTYILSVFLVLLCFHSHISPVRLEFISTTVFVLSSSHSLCPFFSLTLASWRPGVPLLPRSFRPRPMTIKDPRGRPSRLLSQPRIRPKSRVPFLVHQASSREKRTSKHPLPLQWPIWTS